MVDRLKYDYVTYIEATAEKVWEALTSADISASYWGHSNVSDWQTGSCWEHRRVDGSGIADVVGTVLEAAPPHRLVITFDGPNSPQRHDPSRVTFDIEPFQGIVRLTVSHENVANDEDLRAISSGWPAVCANLKSLLETGQVMSTAPWEMHAELRAAQMARQSSSSRSS
jgi:uncharacterized protein YndB with AHSA1/START domain